jgi:hypothetical protein
VEVSYKVTSSAQPQPSDVTNLKGTTAKQLGVSADALTNFGVRSTALSRRRLLASYQWTVTFSVPASSVGSATAAAAALNQPSFASAVATSVPGATLTPGSVATTSAAHAPTRMPVKAPHPAPAPAPAPSNGLSEAAASGIAIAVIAGAILLAGAAFYYIKYYRPRHENGTLDLEEVYKQKMAFDNDFGEGGSSIKALESGGGGGKRLGSRLSRADGAAAGGGHGRANKVEMRATESGRAGGGVSLGGGNAKYNADNDL